MLWNAVTSTLHEMANRFVAGKNAAFADHTFIWSARSIFTLPFQAKLRRHPCCSRISLLPILRTGSPSWTRFELWSRPKCWSCQSWWCCRPHRAALRAPPPPFAPQRTAWWRTTADDVAGAILRPGLNNLQSTSGGRSLPMAGVGRYRNDSRPQKSSLTVQRT